jgi:YegS/Rv2252/BmrU family lipid kinase
VAGACIAHTGSAAWPALPEVLAALRPRFGRLPVHPVSEPGEAERLAAELACWCDPLLVFGGDGTVHEVANGLPLEPEAGGPAVGLLPGGTGNDLARSLGLPADPVAAAGALARAAPRRLDLLDCGARRAANGVNAGFAAAATERLSRRVKRVLGPLAYVAGGVLAGVAPPSWPARVEVDGRVVEGPALAVVVGNGGSFGGGRRLLPEADPADGLLDVLVVPAGHSKARLARGLARHRLDGLPRLRGRAAEVETAMPCRLDGEPAGTPSRITVLPGAWRVLVPERTFR